MIKKLMLGIAILLGVATSTQASGWLIQGDGPHGYAAVHRHHGHGVVVVQPVPRVYVLPQPYLYSYPSYYYPPTYLYPPPHRHGWGFSIQIGPRW